MEHFTSELHPNKLVRYLGKPSENFTKSDILDFIINNNIELLNFRYVGGDGRLKCLNFIINNLNDLDDLLSTGERVDGSSLFPYIEAGSSDLYVVPKYKTAFQNPFSEIPAVDILCTYFDKDGNPYSGAPDNILQKARTALFNETGFEIEAMGELEYYIISPKDDLFPVTDQRGYHESTPFSKWENFRTEAMKAIAQAGGLIKYGHSEVGNFTQNNTVYEQNEIEFLPVKIQDAADQLIIAKWILRTLAYKYGITLTFAPKISVGNAGSGMHIHMRLMKDGKNVFVDKGQLNDTARKFIAGILTFAPSLTAFGNTNPTSYFRLVPHQEAPTNICWGDRNRSVLVRVPLGWANVSEMVNYANDKEPEIKQDFSYRQTIEYRAADGSADIYLLLAGLTAAALHGLNDENSLKIANDEYVSVNIFDKTNKEKLNTLRQMPSSCWESAQWLSKHSKYYTNYNIFTENLLNWTIETLLKYKDKDLRQKINTNKEDIYSLVSKFIHCG